MPLPTISLESVLFEKGASIPPPHCVDSMVGKRLGDIALGALVNAAAVEGCIQMNLPEESYGCDTSTDYY